jgi:hypothetical protein
MRPGLPLEHDPQVRDIEGQVVGPHGGHDGHDGTMEEIVLEVDREAEVPPSGVDED